MSVSVSCCRTQTSAPALSTLAPRSDWAPGTTVPKSSAEGVTWRLQGAELAAVLCSCTFTVPPGSEVTICSCSTTSPEVVGTKLTGMATEAPVVSVTGYGQGPELELGTRAGEQGRRVHGEHVTRARRSCAP